MEEWPVTSVVAIRAALHLVAQKERMVALFVRGLAFAETDTGFPALATPGQEESESPTPSGKPVKKRRSSLRHPFPLAFPAQWCPHLGHGPSTQTPRTQMNLPQHQDQRIAVSPCHFWGSGSWMPPAWSSASRIPADWRSVSRTTADRGSASTFSLAKYARGPTEKIPFARFEYA